MRARWSPGQLTGAIVWATASVIGFASVASTAAASPEPAVHVDTEYAAIGQLIHITGSGWSPVGQTVEIEICGQNARDLSSDCDQGNQYTAAIRTGGVFYGALTVRLPPSPCPCVVTVADQGSFSGVRVPIIIFGAPTAVIPTQSPRAPVALHASLVTPRSASAWFGGPKAVTLILRVTNLTSIAYGSPTLTVNVGRGPNPSGFVLGKQLDPLGARGTRVLRIPVTIPAFTFGRYTLRAQVMTPTGPVAIVVGTSSYPWGLFAVGAIMLSAAALILWRRVRRRKGQQPRSDPGDGQAGLETIVSRPQEVART
jgi:hypothetical protein